MAKKKKAVKKAAKKKAEPVKESKPEPAVVAAATTEVVQTLLADGAKVTSMKQCKSCGANVAKVITVVSGDTTATFVQCQCMLCGQDIRD